MSLHNDLHTWAGRARARGEDTIYITLDTVDKIVEALISSPGKDGGQEVEVGLQPASGSAGLYDFYAEYPDQPASTALVEIVKELSDYLAIHHFASDRHKAADMVARARSALSASQSTSTEPAR